LIYDYDKTGNRIKTGGTWARTALPQVISTSNYNAANRQTILGSKTLTYDDNGNVTSITDASGTTTYTWSARNQLTQISGPGMVASFVYDGLGRREKKTVNGNLTEFLYDGLNPIQEKSGSTVLANNLTGLHIDQSFLRSDVVAGSISVLLSDGLNSTIALTDATGAVQAEYTYEPFGNGTGSGSSNSNTFQFTGRENDSTGLYYYRGRYYHAGLQRFISEDPVRFSGGELNLYSYVNNSPSQYIDPLGLDRLNPEDIQQTATPPIRPAPGVRPNPPIPRNPWQPPGPGWQWRGRGPPGSNEGNWYNPKTGESLHPDQSHPPPLGPHWDYRAPDGQWWRIFPDGSIHPKFI
jgi:RHS repeat-associated protein